jgi:hypothetical protein
MFLVVIANLFIKGMKWQVHSPSSCPNRVFKSPQACDLSERSPVPSLAENFRSGRLFDQPRRRELPAHMKAPPTGMHQLKDWAVFALDRKSLVTEPFTLALPVADFSGFPQLAMSR